MTASIYPFRVTTGAQAVIEKLAEHIPDAAEALTSESTDPILGLYRDTATTCVAVVLSNNHKLYQWAEGPMLPVLDYFERTLEAHGLPLPDEEILRHAGLSGGRA